MYVYFVYILTAVVDILLQQGVSIDSVDSKGCTPLIVAAQYGKIMGVLDSDSVISM